MADSTAQTELDEDVLESAREVRMNRKNGKHVLPSDRAIAYHDLAAKHGMTAPQYRDLVDARVSTMETEEVEAINVVTDALKTRGVSL